MSIIWWLLYETNIVQLWCCVSTDIDLWWFLLMYNDVCWFMHICVDLCWCTMFCFDLCWLVGIYDDMCWFELIYHDLCWFEFHFCWFVLMHNDLCLMCIDLCWFVLMHDDLCLICIDLCWFVMISDVWSWPLLILKNGVFFWVPWLPGLIWPISPGEVSAKEGPLHGCCRGQCFNDPGWAEANFPVWWVSPWLFRVSYRAQLCGDYNEPL